jgi:hypothetical protein
MSTSCSCKLKSRRIGSNPNGREYILLGLLTLFLDIIFSAWKTEPPHLGQDSLLPRMMLVSIDSVGRSFMDASLKNVFLFFDFLKYFRRKIWRKCWRFLLKLLLVFAKI